MLLFFIITVFVLTHLIIAVYDFSFCRIPNIFLGILLVLYAFYAPLYLTKETIVNSLVVFAVVLFLAFGLYALKLIGAGDAKYIAVASLWVEAHQILQFIFLVALVGGGLALLYLVLKHPMGRLSDWVWGRIQRCEASCPRLEKIWMGSEIGPEKGKREAVDPRAIPYGIAIAIGSIAMMISQY